MIGHVAADAQTGSPGGVAAGPWGTRAHLVSLESLGMTGRETMVKAEENEHR